MKILFVEDNKLNREVIAEYLELQGYEVHTLSSGYNFINSIKEFKPNLILLDIKLPGIDGFTLMEQLRSSEWTEVPVIILSALSFTQDKQRAFQLGARRFIVKPAILKEIGRAIYTELRT
ncbi:response regulator [Limnofasciculus baicalensis]|uniref:Response regulator n=1 Tax=Limnofasciculus baicalensis BBK-W-15 TaxID=2699891 RepID=A0AAE3GWB0_9CYAN|nr:response regulator [Limnofasciculus baicalensis]MCP2731033.1 response regulator [Limnofasciculus baicalensis BBK-W-15]